MVLRSSGVPQRGHTPPRPRAGMKRPVCTPPLRIASRVAARSWRRSASSSWTDNSPATRRGESRARHSVSSASRLPTPAITPWSSRRALTAVLPRPTRSRKTSRPTSAASGPMWEKSGATTARPRRRLAQRHPAAVGELEHEAVPAPRRLLLVDHDAARHPEVQAELRPVAVRLRPQELAPPVRGDEPASGQRRGDLARGVGPADIGVAVVDRDDLAIERALDLLPRALCLGELRHALSLRGVPARDERA